MDMQENKFRQNLKSLRLERKMSQSQLASLIGVSQQCVSEWESGNNEPSLSSLWKLSDVLEITIDELVGKS
jgi:transcriptional regulator with XRE-family HTH domain